MSEWQPIETAPEDEWVILATSGEHVGEALFILFEDERYWKWASGFTVSPEHVPLAWMPLPPPPSPSNRP